MENDKCMKTESVICINLKIRKRKKRLIVNV